MIDILVPKARDLIMSRELHGHLCIDIHNTNSGFTERIEQDNTVTTAGNEFMWLNYLAYLRNSSCQRPASVAEGIYGGVCLFTDEITGGTILPLGSNHLVGYAGSETTVTGNQGVYNASESSISETSAVTVWDWGTSQANGTIGSVARTNSVVGNGGFTSYSTVYYGSISETIGYWLCSYIPQDDSTYSYKPIGIDGTTGKIYLYNAEQAAFFEMDYSMSLTNGQGILTNVKYPLSATSISMICSTDNTSYTKHTWYDPTYHKIYWANIVTYGTTSEGVVDIYSVDVSADSPEETMSEVTMAGCYISNNNPVFSDGYLYCSGYDPDDTSSYGIYQLKLSDNTCQFFPVVETLEEEGYTINTMPNTLVPWGTGGIAFLASLSGGAYYTEFKMEQDGSCFIGEGSYTSIPSGKWCSMAAGAGVNAGMLKNSLSLTYYYQHALPLDYMGTYANLASSITKTNSETMKLTYTLTDVT